MTYYYKGKVIESRAEAVECIHNLPIHELYNFVYTYLDKFDKGQLEDLIWSSLDNMGWTLKQFIEDALIMMENNWDVEYSADSLTGNETVSLWDLQYENWPKEDE